MFRSLSWRVNSRQRAKAKLMHRGISGSMSYTTNFCTIVPLPIINRADRRYKECQMMYDEEKSNSTRLQDQINSLNSKNRTLKRNLDDTVSNSDYIIILIIMVHFRKVTLKAFVVVFASFSQS